MLGLLWILFFLGGPLVAWKPLPGVRPGMMGWGAGVCVLGAPPQWGAPFSLIERGGATMRLEITFEACGRNEDARKLRGEGGDGLLRCEAASLRGGLVRTRRA